MDSCFRRNHVAHLIVLEADDGVGNHVKPGECISRLCAAAFTLESKWKSGKGNDREPASRASWAIYGAAPEPVPPPSPVQIKIIRASTSASRISSADSTAA